jgi:hypothetical protein
MFLAFGSGHWSTASNVASIAVHQEQLIDTSILHHYFVS